MHIAIVIPSLGIGGAESMVVQLVNSIDKKLFNILLIVLSDKKGTSLDLAIENTDIKVVYLNKEIGFSFKALFGVYKILNEFKPDIIHTHLSSWVYVFFWAIAYKIKIVHTIHNIPIVESTGIARMVIKRLYKKGLVVPVAISDIIAKQTAILYKLPPKFIVTIYNPVNTGIFNKASRRKSPEGITYINIARFTEQKNQKLLIEAFHRVHKVLPTTQLYLVGDGELRTKVEAKVKEFQLDDYIAFTGVLPDVSNILMQSDIFVLPSRYEGLPLTILEAMAAGLPVIATAVGGVPDIVKGNGILVEEGDIEGLTKAMIDLAQDKSLRENMSKLALAEVRKYDITEVTAQYEQLYEQYKKH